MLPANPPKRICLSQPRTPNITARAPATQHGLALCSHSGSCFSPLLFLAYAACSKWGISNLLHTESPPTFRFQLNSASFKNITPFPKWCPALFFPDLFNPLWLSSVGCFCGGVLFYLKGASSLPPKPATAGAGSSQSQSLESQSTFPHMHGRTNPHLLPPRVHNCGKLELAAESRAEGSAEQGTWITNHEHPNWELNYCTELLPTLFLV